MWCGLNASALMLASVFLYSLDPLVLGVLRGEEVPFLFSACLEGAGLRVLPGPGRGPGGAEGGSRVGL